MTRFRGFKIRGRIVCGFAVVILIGAGVAGYGVTQLLGIGHKVETMNALAGNVIRVLHTSQHLEAISRAENRYQLDADADARKDIEEHISGASNLLTEAASTTLSEARRKTRDGLQDWLRAHKAATESVFKLTDASMDARAKLFTGGDELTAAANKLVQAASGSAALQTYADRVNAAVLLVRVANWRYLATRDPAGPATFKKNFDAANQALDGGTGFDQPDLIVGVRTRLAMYASAFDEYSAASAQASTIFDKQLRPQIVAMQRTLKTVVDSFISDFGTADRTSGELIAGATMNQEICAGAALVLGVVLALLIARSISRPIGAMTAAMRRLAAQDMAVVIPGVGRSDEIGEMASAFQVFKDNAFEAKALERQQADAQQRRAAEDERVRSEAEQAAAAEAASLVVNSIGTGLEHLAAGDLTFRLETPLPPAYEKLRSDLNTAMQQLADLVRSIVANTGALRSGTDEIAVAANDLSHRTEQQAASLEETAAALDQITATVRTTASGAKQAQEAVSRTRTEAEHSGTVVRSAVVAMGEIENSSRQVSQIISVIDEIAFQTNLLALNAGVEAARAGDAGRGFAVVASEVRTLAQRSAEAAKEIKSLIATSAQHVSSGVKLVGETGESLGRIVSQVMEITTTVTQIAESAQEQAMGLGEVNAAINQMDQVTQQNAAMVEQSTAASRALAQETEELARLTSRFQIGESANNAPKSTKPAKAARPAAETSHPAPRAKASAARLKVVSRAGGSTARQAAPAENADQEGWTEF